MATQYPTKSSTPPGTGRAGLSRRNLLLGAVGLALSATLMSEGANSTETIVKPELKPGRNVVSYINQGDKIVAHLYLPNDYVAGEKRPAIVLNPPATGVKEQTIGVYAEALSKKGFITLAFDPRGFGDSEGIRQLQDPYRMADDISKSVSFLQTLEAVDGNSVFSLGICAGAGYAAYATAFDTRIKALAIISPFLTTSEEYFQIMGSAANMRARLLPGAAAAEKAYYENGENMMMKIVPTTEKELAAARGITAGMMDYYLPGKPGDIPNWRNELSLLSMRSALSFSIYDYAKMFDTIPVFMAYGEDAVSADGAKRFFEALKGPKEVLMLEKAGHFDLYWKPKQVGPAVEGISKFLTAQIEHNKAQSAKTK